MFGPFDNPRIDLDSELVDLPGLPEDVDTGFDFQESQSPTQTNINIALARKILQQIQEQERKK